MRFKKLLVATDFSEPSREAFATGTAMAAESGAELVLVHVVATPYFSAEVPVMLDAALADAKEELDLLVRDAKRRGVERVSAQLLQGTPWNEVVQLARRDPAFDLLVVGTHGRTGIKHVLLGSVAEKIVRHAPCPVLVVRAHERDAR